MAVAARSSDPTEMGTGYLVYHALRLSRQALGNVREARRRDRPMPGDNPYGVSQETVVLQQASLRRLIAEREKLARRFGEHPFEPAPLTRGPHGELIQLCSVCGLWNDGVVHRPSW